jgi:hypothetical protein
VIIDADGKAWCFDFESQCAGVVDTNTGAVKEIAMPVLKPDEPKGGLDLELSMSIRCASRASITSPKR